MMPLDCSFGSGHTDAHTLPEIAGLIYEAITYYEFQCFSGAYKVSSALTEI